MGNNFQFTNMNVNNLSNWLANPGMLNLDIVWVIIKWMLVLGLVLYCFVALVIIKQVGIMSETLEDPANGVVKAFAWMHLIFAIVLTGLVIVVG